MREVSLAAEAASCRKNAEDFAGLPERPFLLSIADAFDELARDEAASTPNGVDVAGFIGAVETRDRIRPRMFGTKQHLR